MQRLRLFCYTTGPSGPLSGPSVPRKQQNQGDVRDRGERAPAAAEREIESGICLCLFHNIFTMETPLLVLLPLRELLLVGLQLLLLLLLLLL